MSRHILRASGTLTLPIQQANRTDRGNGESHQCSPSSRHTEPHATGTWRKDVRHTSREMNESQQKSEQRLVKTCRNHCSTNSETENLANLISCLHISPSLSALSIRIHYILTHATIGTAPWNVTQKAASPLCRYVHAL